MSKNPNKILLTQTYAQTNKIQQGSNTFISTQVGNQSKIQATNGNLVLQANKNIENIGSSLEASNTIALNTQDGDINFKTLELRNEQNLSYSGGFNKALNIEHLKATASAGENLILSSGKDINLEAANLNANNQINLNAINDVNITAVNDVKYTDVQTSSKGFMSKKTQRDMTYEEAVQSAQLSAKDIVINANNDVTLEATKLKAQDNIIVNAKEGDINILAKEYREGELHQSSKSSWGGLKKSLDISSSDALKLNSALLETQAANVVLTSGKDINILASEISSAGDIQLKALNDVLITSQQESLKSKEVHEKSSFNVLGIVDPLGMGMLDSSIYSKEVNKNDKVSSSNISSTLNAKENIIIDSGTTNIVGSNLSAKNVSIKADTGTVNILSSEDVFNESSLDKKIDFSLSNPIDMIKNEIKGLTEQKTKLKFELGSLTYDEVDKVSKDTVNTSSNITASEGNVVINSFDDVNIKGSNITASDAIAIKSEIGNVNITNAQDSTSTQTAEKHAKASVSATVQNEYAEIGTAVKSALESAEQLKQVKSDYSDYKGEVKKLENTLTNLKQSYKNKEVGIDYSDIEDLVDIVDNVKSQEKYYVAALAAATADLASKTVAVATQSATAAASSGTWGFSVGMSLDVNGEKSKTNTNSTTSIASILQANDIYIQTDDELQTAVNVTGSNIIAQNYLSIDTYDLNVKASQDTSTSSLDSKSVNGSIAFTMYGGGGGTAGLGYGQQNNSSDSLSNNNSQLIAKNIDIKTANDANFIGANVKASDTLNLDVGNNLTLESLRDEYTSNSNGFNVNAGVGFGSVNAGFSVNNGSTMNKQTVLSSIAGNKVNVNVENNTHIKGALLSSGEFQDDGSFIDNKNLNLNTNTLTFENLSNTSYSSNQSVGASANYNLEGTTIVNQKEKPEEGGISSATYTASNSLGISASKTLATLGNGNVIVKDIENSDELDRLNRDTLNVNKDLYSSQTGTSVDATLDTRLLTEDGQKDIVNDLMDSKTITDAIEQIATTKKVGALDFFKEVEKNLAVKNGINKKIANDKELAANLTNSNLTPKEKEQMLAKVAVTVMTELGYVSNETKLISTSEVGQSGVEVKGHYNLETNTNYVNDQNNSSTEELVTTVGHEITHAMDKQAGIFKAGDTDQNVYATNFGEDLSSYTNHALYMNDGASMATTNTHNSGQVTTVPSVFNDNTFAVNNAEFSGLDKSNGDDRKLSTEEKALPFTQNANDLKDALVQTSNLSKKDIDNIFEITQKAMVNKMDDYMLNLQLKTTYKDKTDEIDFVINEAKQYFTEESKGQTYLDRNSMTLKPMMDINNFNNSTHNPSSNSAIISSTVGSVIRTGLGLVPNPYIAIPAWVLDTSINYEGNGLDVQNTIAPAFLGQPFITEMGTSNITTRYLQYAPYSGAGVSIFNTIQSVDSYSNNIENLEMQRDNTNSQELQNIYNNTNPIEIKKIETPQLNLIKVNP